MSSPLSGNVIADKPDKEHKDTAPRMEASSGAPAPPPTKQIVPPTLSDPNKVAAEVESQVKTDSKKSDGAALAVEKTKVDNPAKAPSATDTASKITPAVAQKGPQVITTGHEKAKATPYPPLGPPLTARHETKSPPPPHPVVEEKKVGDSSKAPSAAEPVKAPVVVVPKLSQVNSGPTASDAAPVEKKITEAKSAAEPSDKAATAVVVTKGSQVNTDSSGADPTKTDVEKSKGSAATSAKDESAGVKMAGSSAVDPGARADKSLTPPPDWDKEMSTILKPADSDTEKANLAKTSVPKENKTVPSGQESAQKVSAPPVKVSAPPVSTAQVSSKSVVSHPLTEIPQRRKKKSKSPICDLV